MGASKTAPYSVQQNELALLAKALGHPARIAIIDYLVKVNACMCGDIVNELPLTQPTVSQHLRELKTVGIIKGNIEGNAICYCVDEHGIEKILNYLTDLKYKISSQNQCCSI